MSFKIRCECGRILVVPERREGTRVKCPDCGSKLVVQKEAEVHVTSRRQRVTQPKRPATPDAKRRRSETSDDTPTSPKSATSTPQPKRLRSKSRSNRTDDGTPQDATASRVAKPSRETTTDATPPSTPKPKRNKPTREKKARKRKSSAARTKTTTQQTDSPAPNPATDVPPEAPHQAPASTPPPPPTQQQPPPTEETELSPARRQAQQTPPPLPKKHGRSSPPTPDPAASPASSPTASPTPSANRASVASDSPTTAAAESSTDTPTRRLRGVEWDQARRSIAGYAGLGLAVIALTSLVPAGFDLAQHLQSVHSTGLSRWAVLLFCGAALQLAYAGYVLQLRDWGTVWVTSALSFCLATTYVAFFTLLWMSQQQSIVLDALDLGGHIDHRKATGWCFIMFCMTGMFCYLSARSGARWYRLHRRLSQEA